jgi:hypothetical protein
MNNYLKLGEWNAICDVCGYKFKASMLRKRWDGLMVCNQDYELRHPQDFLRVPLERVSPPWVRLEPEDVFTDVGFGLQTENDLPILTESGLLILTG